MIVGCGLTALTSERGTLYLKAGASAQSYEQEDGREKLLPNKLTLIKFKTEYYPGMNFPRDFISVLKTANGDTLSISMNKIGRIDGYRFYQSSFDGKGGTVLIVTHDPWGNAVTYCGYILFAVCGLVIVARYFNRRKYICCVLLSSVALSIHAAPAISERHGDDIAYKQVIFRGRIVPFSTVGKEFTLKITGQNRVGELTPERFLASIILYPEEWSRQPILYVKDKQLRKTLGMTSSHISPANLYKNGKYVLEAIYEGGNGKHDKSILALDEKIALFNEAVSGNMFIPLADSSHLRKSDLAIKAEVIYNHYDPLVIYFTIGMILGLALLISGFKYTILWQPYIILCYAVMGLLIYAWLWWIVGYFPLACAGQVMQFMSMCIAFIGFLIARNYQNINISAVGVIMSALTAVVAWISYRNPVITPLMPVLSSIWLTIHVSLVMTAYAILVFTTPLSIYGLICKSRRTVISTICRDLLVPGVYLLGLGIITGTVWANISWGRYWAWDPKETWALVTMLIYSIALHKSIVPDRYTKLFLSILIIGFGAIVMTYVGVNMLPSLHAYQ